MIGSLVPVGSLGHPSSGQESVSVFKSGLGTSEI